MSSMNVYLFTILFALGIHQGLSQRCHLKEIIRCYFDNRVYYMKYPDTEEGLEKMCENNDEAQTCFDNYMLKCMSPSMREFFDTIKRRPLGSRRELCTPGTDTRKNYLQEASCISEVMQGEDGKQCAKEGRRKMQAMSDDNSNKWIPMGCCAYQGVKTCLRDVVLDKCGKLSEEIINIVNEAIPFTTFDFVCGIYDPNGPSCLNVSYPPMSEDQKVTFPLLVEYFFPEVTPDQEKWY